MKIDQIAIVADKDFTMKNVFGPLMHEPKEWSEDRVVAKGIVRDWRADETYQKCHNAAILQFNYDLVPGKEFELIYYVDGRNFLEWLPPGMLSHIGTHVIAIDNHRNFLKHKGWMLVQEVVTQSHTSPKVKGARRYHYAIYEHPLLKFRLKLIERTDDIHADMILERIYDLL